MESSKKLKLRRCWSEIMKLFILSPSPIIPHHHMTFVDSWVKLTYLRNGPNPLFLFFFKLSSLLSQVPEMGKDLAQLHHFFFPLLCYAIFLLSRN